MCASLAIRQRDIEPFDETSPRSLIDLLRTVRGSNDEDAIVIRVLYMGTVLNMGEWVGVRECELYRGCSKYLCQVQSAVKKGLDSSSITTITTTNLSYKLNEKFRFDASARFNLAIRALGQQRVNLVHKDDGGLMDSCHGKQSTHHFLAFTHVF